MQNRWLDTSKQEAENRLRNTWVHEGSNGDDGTESGAEHPHSVLIHRRIDAGDQPEIRPSAIHMDIDTTPLATETIADDLSKEQSRPGEMNATQEAILPMGPTGPQGEHGVQGPTGARGATGPIGPKGEPGSIGLQGPRGATGATGAKGDPGAKGEPGAKGDIGPKGEKGERGAVGPRGATGEMGPAGKDGAAPKNAMQLHVHAKEAIAPGKYLPFAVHESMGEGLALRDDTAISLAPGHYAIAYIVTASLATGKSMTITPHIGGKAQEAFAFTARMAGAATRLSASGSFIYNARNADEANMLSFHFAAPGNGENVVGSVSIAKLS